MRTNTPKHKIWQSIALLVAAIVVLMLISADGVSGKHLAMGWMGMIALTVTGAFVLLKATGITK